jgi:hypothetical protein
MLGDIHRMTHRIVNAKLLFSACFKDVFSRLFVTGTLEKESTV